MYDEFMKRGAFWSRSRLGVRGPARISTLPRYPRPVSISYQAAWASHIVARMSISTERTYMAATRRRHVRRDKK